jgi:hypothetical protein
MSACPQCGTVAKPSDKFCNVCGTPVAQAGAAPGGPPGGPAFGAPPPPPFAPAGPGGFGGPPQPGFAPPPGVGGARCQMGHDIAPGASYCAQGHPLALDQMQFNNDQYGAPQGGYAPPPGGGFGAPPQAPPYGAPPGPPAPAFGAPPPAGGFPGPAPAFGAPPPAPGFGAPQGQPGFPPPAQPGFGAPPGAAPAFGGAPGFGGNNDTSRDAVPAKIVRGFLVAYGSNPAGDFWPLTGGKLLVGRLGATDGIDISLQDPTISSRHAAIVVDGPSGSVAVEDTGSTNGTFVNDEHIGFNGRRELRDGDRLRFGGYTTIVKVVGRV